MGLARGRSRASAVGWPLRRLWSAMARTARHARLEAAANLREAMLAATAAIDDARVVAILLALAAAALALEMAASFHLI
jgi:hypothetical protein